MKNCKMCGTPLAYDAAECPNCKFKIKSSNNINMLQKGAKGYVIFVISLIVIFFLITVGMFIYIGSKHSILNDKANKMEDNMNNETNDNDDTNNNDKTIDKEEQVKNIELLNGAKIIKDGFYYIDGILRNNNNQDINNVRVTFVLYDANGALLDTRYETAVLIEANGTWHFKVNCGLDEPNNFKIKAIEIY